MTIFYLNLERLKQRKWNRSVILLTLIFLGVAFASTECRAQAVPSRNQYQIMTRPVVRPPEPPLQKEIRENRREITENKVVLERKIEAEKTRRFLTRQAERRRFQLGFLLGELYSAEMRKMMDECPDSKCQCRKYIAPFIERLEEMKRLYEQAGMPE